MTKLSLPVRVEPLSLLIEPPILIAVVREGTELIFRWTSSVPLKRLYSGIHPDHIDRDTPISFTGDGVHARIVLNVLGAHHGHAYFELVFADGVTRTAAERALPLEGGVNFRDIGGYATQDGRTVRWGKVYRSGALETLTSNDLAYLERLGIQMVCDLRLPDEAAAHPDKTLPGAHAYATPITTDTHKLLQLITLLRYRKRLDQLLLKGYIGTMIDKNAAVFGAIYNRLADSNNLPAILHCTAGKDRAGMTTALLLLALGVPESTVAADYSLSNRFYPAFKDVAEAQAARLRRLGITIDHFHPMLLADPQTMHRAIAYINEKYDGVIAYLRDKAGVSEATIGRLRELLLE